jgi:RimJ/RimL family protein N-acetyltransferase
MPEKMNRSQIQLVPWAEPNHDLLRRINAPEMMEHLGGPETEEQLLIRHQRYLTLSERGKGHMFSILLLPDNEIVGSIGYWDSQWQGESIYEVGWSVLPEYQGRGLASSALAAVVAHASLEAKHVWMHAFPSVHNPASNTVCRKLNFTPLSECEFEYPPGNFMLCRDWRLAVGDFRLPSAD